MPWQTPTLQQLRQLNADNVTARLRSGPMIPNSVLRVMSDANAGLAYLTLLYLNWLALQLMPDTAEKVWLDRFGTIWVGGRKPATFAAGSVTVVGINGTVLPLGALMIGVGANNANVTFQTTQQITVGTGATPVNVVALTSGAAGNLAAGAMLNLGTGVAGVNGQATVVALAGGTDQETDDALRARVLERIRKPPMGGDADDYVQWALGFPGVTRAWCSPNEMGIGTVTVRFMMDDLRATSAPTTNGFPLTGDVAALQSYLDGLRPVAVKDFFVAAPLPEPINFTVSNLSAGNAATQAAIAVAVTAMLAGNAAPAYALNGVGQPAQTIYAAWVSDAILNAAGVDYFDLTMADHVMPSAGSLAVLGIITFP